MCKCPCGCEFEVTRERAVVIRCPNCDIVVIAPDMERAEQLLAVKIKGKQNEDKGDGKGGTPTSGSEKA